MKFSIRQVRKMLGISESTFYRKVRAGALQIEHDPTEKTRTGLPRVWVTLEAIGAFLGITDDAALRVRLELPEITHDVRINDNYEDPKQEPLAPRSLTAFEQKELTDQRIAEDAVADPEWRDSYGHKITGNEKHNYFVTPDDGPRETQSHMDPALLGTNPHTPITNPQKGEGFTRTGELLAAGLSQDTYDAMLRDWNRTHHGRDALSMGEQMEKEHWDRTAIRSAFPRNTEPQRSARQTTFTPNGGRMPTR